MNRGVVQMTAVALGAASGVAFLGCGGPAPAPSPLPSQDGSWTEPVRFAEAAFNPRAASRPDGDVVVVWEKGALPRNFYHSESVWAQVLTAADAWNPKTPDRLDQPDSFPAPLTPVVSVAADGAALAAWARPTDSTVWAGVRDPGRGWMGAALVPASEDGQSPAVVLDSEGNGLLAWDARASRAVRVARYVRGRGFVRVEEVTPRDAGPFRIAMDAGGDGLLAWAQEERVGREFRLHAWVLRFDPSSGWGAAEPLQQDASRDAVVEDVAFDRDGNALVVWSERRPPPLDPAARLLARAHPAGGGGGRIQLLGDPASDARLALDPRGGAVAAWIQEAPPGVFSARFDLGSGWGTQEPVVSSGDVVGPPALAVDPAGNVLVAWREQAVDMLTLRTARKPAGGRWSAPVAIPVTRSVRDAPWLGVAPSGRALLLWSQVVGAYPSLSAELWGARFERE